MDQVLTWGAIIGSLGAITAAITFWVNVGKAQQKAASDAESARADVKSIKEDVKALWEGAGSAKTIAAAAVVKSDLLLVTLNDARLEFARDYVNHKTLNATEERMAAAVESVKTELTKVNDRLYQILDRLSVKT